jgi:hypothetical protein
MMMSMMMILFCPFCCPLDLLPGAQTQPNTTPSPYPYAKPKVQNSVKNVYLRQHHGSYSHLYFIKFFYWVFLKRGLKKQSSYILNVLGLL